MKPWFRRYRWLIVLVLAYAAVVFELFGVGGGLFMLAGTLPLIVFLGVICRTLMDEYPTYRRVRSRRE